MNTQRKAQTKETEKRRKKGKTNNRCKKSNHSNRNCEMVWKNVCLFDFYDKYFGLKCAKQMT